MTPAVRRVRSLMQFGQTQRYHTELLLKPQDVAQHSYNVAWLCWELSLPTQPRQNLIMAALSHDAGERWTGDMTAPAKRAIPGMRESLDALEAKKMAEHGAEEAAEWHLRDDEKRILKLADAMEGAWFCLREVKLGNMLMVDAIEGGAAFNFMSYVEGLLVAHPHPVGQELFNYLRTEYDKYRQHHHIGHTVVRGSHWPLG